MMPSNEQVGNEPAEKMDNPNPQPKEIDNPNLQPKEIDNPNPQPAEKINNARAGNVAPLKKEMSLIRVQLLHLQK